MDRIQRERKEYRLLPRGYYHLDTDGWSGGELFHTIEQYVQGMAGIALLSIKFGVTIYAFELMPNHIHILLSGTGAQCLECFYFLIRRINKKLRADGYPPLPNDYWLKLTPINNRESMRQHVIYLARNKYEKNECTPFGHMWGTGYLIYNQIVDLIEGRPVSSFLKKDIEQLTGSQTPLPPHWLINPVVGVLPSNYVDIPKLKELFPSVRHYLAMMVKDYEAIVRISNQLGEAVEWSEDEARDILSKVCSSMFPGKSLFTLSADEKSKLAVRADSTYQLPATLMAPALGLSVHVLGQVLRSKEYGIRK